MSESEWATVAVVADALSAQVLCDRLVAEGVPAQIRADTPLLGVARRCRIVAPARLMHRVRTVLSQAEFTDEELTRLAMEGEAAPPETDETEPPPHGRG